MENNTFPPSSRNKLLPIHDEQFIREVNYGSGTSKPYRQNKQHMLLEILQNSDLSSDVGIPQRILVTIKPRANIIKTLYIAEKSRFHSKKGSDKSGSRLAIGDHYAISSYGSNVTDVSPCDVDFQSKRDKESNEIIITSLTESNTTKLSSISLTDESSQVKNVEKCTFTRSMLTTMNVKTEIKTNERNSSRTKIDKATLIITNTSSDESLHSYTATSVIKKLNARIDYLERKVFKQDIAFRSIDPMLALSSDEESKRSPERPAARPKRRKRTFIEQYSHVPEASAFHRYAQASSLCPSKATSIDKEHNSEQYGRDFTTYDGITARGRRQCASVPLKRDDTPKAAAAERIHKIRHKLNPVRDYRLMDTVHYLAQGEFAPRDDGIKLTQSREAVLSDIIYEDVCRTHWPNTRLGRRLQHSDRHSTRYELQRLIDSLLRERVAHVERRRRRHYRIVKLNHRHENGKPMGKTGDIIVASNKNKHIKDRDIVGSDCGGTGMFFDKHNSPQYSRNHRSQERVMYQEDKSRQKHRLKHDDCLPGPSHAVPNCGSREPTCCYHTNGDQIIAENAQRKRSERGSTSKDLTNTSSILNRKPNHKTPRLVIKREASKRKYNSKEQPNLEHFILLPTLVVRTPSNVRRQKKFNELYHRILNVQFNEERDGHNNADELQAGRIKQSQNKKDMSFNINIISSDSDNNENRKL